MAPRFAPKGIIVLATLLIVMSFGSSAHAWYRFYGNVNIAWQNSKTTRLLATEPLTLSDSLMNDTARDGSFRQTAFFNYEDSLPGKSTARLALNLDRREQTYTHRTDFRPIWYLDINNPRLSLRSSYSSYTIKGVKDSTVSVRQDVLNREVRLSGGTQFLKLPNLTASYNRTRAKLLDSLEHGRTVNENATAELFWFKDWYSIRGGHTRVDRHEDQNNINTFNRAWNGTAAITKAFGTSGSLASTYNIFRTKYASPAAVTSRSLIHSASTVVSTRLFKTFGVNASYSGRFSTNEDRNGTFHDRSEAMSSQLSWAPLSYFDVSVLKTYQIDRERGNYQIGEYLTASAQSTRYLRPGIDTRASWSRTWYQQSSRERQVIENGDTTMVNASDYFTDTWYASFDGSPFRYTRTRYAATLTRQSDPVRADQRWQLTHSFDFTANLSSKLDGRFSATALYQGDRLRLGHVYSKSYNAGLNWIPRNNVSASVAYTWSIYNTYLRFVNNTVSGTLSYRYRRAFSFYLTANRQEQPSVEFQSSSTTPKLTQNKPTALNAQLQLFVTQRTTAIIGYIVTRSDYGSPKVENRSRTWLASVNMQM